MKTISERLGDSTAQQLLVLMREGASADPVWSDRDLSAILRFRLACPLASSVATASTGGGSEETPDPGRHTLRDLLTSTTPDLELLRAVRDYAKQTRSQAGGALPNVVATVLYYAAIAAALVRCDRKITSLSDQAMRDGFRWSAARPWIAVSVRTILETAIAAVDARERKTP